MRIVINDESHDVAARTTVAELLADLEVEPRHVAVEVNLALVPRSEHGERELRAGDILEIVTLVGGG